MKNGSNFENKFERRQIRHASLFSGIGGFDMAAQWCGWENVFQVEIDEWCRKVLAKNFPKTKQYEDIKEFDGTKYRGAVDVISAGVPCQPASVAGSRKGDKDDRWLWQEAIRVFGETKPTFIVCENPVGIISLENGRPFERILSEMADIGYETELFNIPAAGVGAWHRRERIWIVAHANDYGNKRGAGENEGKSSEEQIQERNKMEQLVKSVESRILANTKSAKCGRNRHRIASKFKKRKHPTNGAWWQIEPELVRVVHGVSGGMDRYNRVKALGNAVVPQIPYILFRALEEIYFQNEHQHKPYYEKQE